MTQEEYEKGFVDYMTKNNGKDYEKCYNKEHIADMKADFLSGAEWRINSVWHKPNEEPKYDKYFLYENVVHAYHVDGIYPSEDELFVWNDYVKDWGLMRWAYVEDLIP